MYSLRLCVPNKGLPRRHPFKSIWLQTMFHRVQKYALRVHADYSSVVFPVGSAQFVGEGEFDGKHLVLAGQGMLTFSGDLAVTIAGHGVLTLTTHGFTTCPIGTLVQQGASLEVRYRTVCEGTTRIVHDVRVENGASYRERIAADVRGLFDVLTTVTHEGCAKSDIVTKVAVHEGGKAIVRGKIVLGSGAEGSTGIERIDALLLGQKAEADVLPTMVVDTDDVACKHGASVGHIDEAALFYLASRGVDPGAARSVLTEAFLRM